MKDTEFYAQILGLKKPWEVRAVRLDMAAKKVEVELGCEAKTWWGNEEGERLPVYDHVERRWRHLDTCGFATELVCRVPRVEKPDGKVETVSVPWGEKGSRFTLLFEAWAVAVLNASRSVSQACELLGISWEAAHRIMKRAVQRGLDRRKEDELPYVGMDEKSFLRGQSYVSVLTDLLEGRVLEVVDGRDQVAAQCLLASLSDEQRESIEAVSIDMAASFQAALEAELPGVEIVHDKFHIVQHLNEAVDQIRRAESKALAAEGDNTLKGTRQIWLVGEEKQDPEQAAQFAALKGQQLKVGRAWAMKEMFRRFWDSKSEGWARRFFADWKNWVDGSGLTPMKKVARMLAIRLENIVSYLRHPITNAVTEGLNSKIQTLKANARGFRNFEHYRIRILFFCGKLNLHPL
jgi:transposase